MRVSKWNDNSSYGIEESFDSIIIISIAIFCSIQCEIIPVRPEKTIRQSHNQTCSKNTPSGQFIQRHHSSHGYTAEQHTKGI